MRLTKVRQVPKLIPGPPGKDGQIGPMGPRGPAGRDGRDGKDGVSKVVREVIERTVSLEEYKAEVAALRKQALELNDRFEWLKKRQPEYAPASSPAVSKYLFTLEQESRWSKSSFVEGMNIIGVRYNGAATVYLPHNLDPTMIVAVKDESGSGNITVYVE